MQLTMTAGTYNFRDKPQVLDKDMSTLEREEMHKNE
jgi:hypothetical protein